MIDYLYGVVSLDDFENPVAFFSNTTDAKWYGDHSLGEKNYGVKKYLHYNTVSNMTADALGLLEKAIKYVPKGKAPTNKDMLEFVNRYKNSVNEVP